MKDDMIKNGGLEWMQRHDMTNPNRFLRKSDNRGPKPQGAWWGKAIVAIVFLGIVAYIVFKLATMQP